LAMAIVALYLSTCCPGWIVLAGGLGLGAAAAFAAWLAACSPGPCQVLDYLLVTVVTVAATTIGYIVLIPAIAACGSVAAALGVTTAAAILGIAVPICHEVSEEE
jgi:hypothetical protein